MAGLTLLQAYGFEDTVPLYIFMAGVGCMVLLALAVMRASLLHWLMGAVLLFASLTGALTDDKTAYLPSVFLMLQKNRAELHLGAGILLSAMLLLTGRAHVNLIPTQVWYIFGIVVYQGLLQFVHDTPEIGLQTVLFGLATIPCMGIATTLASNSYENCRKTVQILMGVSIAWSLGCAVQFVVEPSYLVSGGQGRFLGLLGNAQHAAVLVAPMAVIALWLLINDRGRVMRVLWMGLLGINLLFLAWTGSRTGMLQLVLGVTIVLYRRVGQAVLLLPVAGGMLWLLAMLAENLEIGKNLERLVSTENTRVGLVESLLGSIGENPWIGVGWHDLGFSENSYLVGFAGYGFVMFLLMMGLLLFSGWKCVSLIVHRGRLAPHEQPLVEVFVAFNAMYFAGAAFEGYMLGRSNTPQEMMLIFAGIGVWLGKAVTRPRTAGEVVEELDGYPAHGAVELE